VKFTHRYKLLKDTPKYKAGWELGWSGNDGKFYFYKVSEWKHDNGKRSIYLDYDSKGFSVEEIKDTEWFKPIGKEVDFIPRFPSRARIEEYIDLMPSCRLVNNVDECRAINLMLDNKEFQNRLYDFYNEQYNAFHKLLNASGEGEV
jgi:hypothetical protein